MAARRRRLRIPTAWWIQRERIVRQLAVSLARRLARVWLEMGTEAIRRLELPGPITPAMLIDLEAEERVAQMLIAHAEAAAGQGRQDALLLLGLFDLPMPEVPLVAHRLADRIRGINETTRRQVQAVIVQSLAEGASIDQIRDRLRGLFAETYRNRALTVARTESALAYNWGTLHGVRESAMTNYVLVFDGDGCGWHSHDDPDKAHGSIRSIDEAERYPLAHPNCRRAMAPWLP